MKRKIRIIITLIMIITIISISVINSFAYEETYTNYTTIPTDIGEQLTGKPSEFDNIIHKYYLKIELKK